MEIFFGIVNRQAIRRGTFTSVADPEDAIRQYIDAYNDRCQPFAWTKTTDEILKHAAPKRPRTGPLCTSHETSPRTEAAAVPGLDREICDESD